METFRVYVFHGRVRLRAPRQAWALLGAVGGIRGEHWMKSLSTELVTSTSLFWGLGRHLSWKVKLGRGDSSLDLLTRLS